MATGKDSTQSGATKIYQKQQPAGTTFNGNTITTEEVCDVGSLQNTFGVEALNGVALPAKVGFAFAAGAANVATVTITIQDNGGQPITGYPFDFDLVLSDAATGVGLTAVTASGAVTTTTGIILSTYTAKKALYVQSDANGVVVLSITDTAKTGFYVMVNGTVPIPVTSRVMTSADYG